MDYDLAICRAFAYKVSSHTTDRNFAKLPHAFPRDGPPLPKLDGIRSRVAFLAGFKPDMYDCCPNSCICYTGPHDKLKECPYCKEARYRADNITPRKTFTYLPLIPRLIAFAKNREMAEKMQYRSQYRHTDGRVDDIFDGTTYESLRRRNIRVGKVLLFKYFADARDVALGLSTDGFAPHKRRKSTAWPLILFNYNLPPEIRFHLNNIISLGVIPGPKKPHDIDSFLWPMIREFVQLAQGVRAYDILSSEIFALRAFLVVVFGDIPAVSMLMHMKGHNGISPCRMCKITAVRGPDGSKSKTYYVPHDRSCHPDIQGDPDAIQAYDLEDLPMRTHEEILAQGAEVEAADTAAKSDRLATEYGVKGIPGLSYLDSLSFPTSFPYDFMHLIWENLIKNLVLHWTGEFKGLDDGEEEYSFPKAVWEAVGAATASSGSTIPSAYGTRVPNLSGSRANVSAEMWSFWTLYLGPILLRRRFLHRKYFIHFSNLVRLLNICLQFEISEEEIEEVRTGFIKWVTEYEECVSPPELFRVVDTNILLLIQNLFPT